MIMTFQYSAFIHYTMLQSLYTISEILFAAGQPSHKLYTTGMTLYEAISLNTLEWCKWSRQRGQWTFDMARAQCRSPSARDDSGNPSNIVVNRCDPLAT